MVRLLSGWSGVVAITAVLMGLPAGLASAAPDSQRLGRAKDYIADEQWPRAIAELRMAIADPKEKSRDEALYWLAHCLNQGGDPAAAIETIRQLEREYPSSLWVKPAGSLRLDIAVHMQRHDVLWWTVEAPPPAPAVAAPLPPAPPAAAPPAPVRARAASTVPPPADGPAWVPATPPRASASPRPAPAPPIPPTPPAAWIPDGYRPDADLRIQALGSLMRTDAQRVIPILKEIALESTNEGAARRAIFVLAQSGKAEARETVVQVAKLGPEPVRIAAVREIGRFGGPEASRALLQVYSTANVRVKRQVVTSLGERAERTALLRIAESESDPRLKETAIVTLGQAGGGDQLRILYQRAPAQAKLPIIAGLFSARAEDELIRIAEHERDTKLREEALLRLRLMGTPKAKEYLQKIGRIR